MAVQCCVYTNPGYNSNPRFGSNLTLIRLNGDRKKKKQSNQRKQTSLFSNELYIKQTHIQINLLHRFPNTLLLDSWLAYSYSGSNSKLSQFIWGVGGGSGGVISFLIQSNKIMKEEAVCDSFFGFLLIYLCGFLYVIKHIQFLANFGLFRFCFVFSGWEWKF